jgi:8-oxo-dGTP diphosphatase
MNGGTRGLSNLKTSFFTTLWYINIKMDKEVAKVYGNKVRVRACGICWHDDKLLMVNHSGITPTNFWAPPGGGVEFGQSIEEAIKKEFLEETGFHVAPGDFLFGCEYIEHPIHSIELFYSIAETEGKLRKGYDPEIQIIKNVKFLSATEILELPTRELHGIFRFVKAPGDLRALRGFFRI